ncbi:MAG: hypothetical protein JW769_02755 [Parachlamydiales bacterium]|nr:hypothetical protein [Parachlamydiales bacterium]
MDNYSNVPWDTMDPQQRNALLLEQAIETTLFAKKNVPFYQKYYQKLQDIDIQNIRSLDEFAHVIPETTRHHLTHNKHTIFLPENPQKIKMNKATGGTTTDPIVMCFTKEDINIIAKTTARSIAFDYHDRPNTFTTLKILGLYHGDHITNHFFRPSFELLGMEFFDRISTKNAIEPNYNFFLNGSLNAILGPPGGVLHKGLSLSTFFEYDAAHIFHHLPKKSPILPIEAVFWSSAPMDPELLDYMKNTMKIPYIKGIYGSTEAAPVGTTCPYLDHSFHLDYNPILTLLKTPTGIAKNMERGYLLVSKTGFNDYTGTVLINYRNGDSALLTEGVCQCGRNSPIIHEITRIEDVKAKSVYGCEAD